MRPLLLLNVAVMMGGRKSRERFVVMLGALFSGAPTACFADRGRCCVGAEKHHQENNRRQSARQHNFHHTLDVISTQLAGLIFPKRHSDLDLNASVQ